MLAWGLGLMAVAFVLLIVDIFVPTFGVLSLLSVALSLGGVICLFQVDALWGFIGLGIVLIGGPAVFFFGLQIMPSTPLGRKLILGADDPQNEDGGGVRKAIDETERHLLSLIGTEAVVLSDLRPIGTVAVADRRYDALSETTLVRAGDKVRITSVDAGTLKVRPV
jgi:membrane-bound ClpP family serine protease